MFRFTDPIWLFASAGILIPLIIHLWNIQQGKTRKVGSIMLLTENPAQKAKSLRISELLLLLIRCILIIFLSFLLAGPVLLQEINTAKEKGWIVIEEQKSGKIYAQFKPTIDSLVNSGYSLHYFDTAFSDAGVADIEDQNKNGADETLTPYWQTLAKLDQKLPAGFPVFLFTGNRLSGFKGKRPEISLDLKWMLYSSSDSISEKIVAARQISPDSIRLFVSNNSSSAISYSYGYISSLKPGSNTSVRWDKKKPDHINLDSLSIKPDTASVNITIFSEKADPGAHYLSTAIKAIENFGKFRIRLSVVTDPALIPKNEDMIFWISDRAVPATITTKKIFIYEKGNPRSTNSWITNGDGPLLSQPALINKFIEHSAETSKERQVLWKNGYGHPILTLEEDSMKVFRFYSRFDPGWNDLVWSETFPELIYGLIEPGKIPPPDPSDDKRVIDQQQSQAVLKKKISGSYKARLVHTTPLDKLTWLIVFALFFTERILSSLKRKKRSYA